MQTHAHTTALSNALTALPIKLLLCLTMSFNAHANSSTYYDLSLSELLNLTVSIASKKEEKLGDAPGVISIITRKEIDGFASKNLGEILNKVTSTVFLSPDVFTDQSVVMRGQSLTPYNNHMLILFNGRPLRDPVSGGMNSPIYAAFPVDIIDHIEVIRGPGSVLYGSTAYAGVISIITKDTDTNELNTTSEISSHDGLGQQLSIATVSNDFKIRTAVKYEKNDGPTYEFYDYADALSSDQFHRNSKSIASVISFQNLELNIFHSEFLPYSLNGKSETWQQEPLDSFTNEHISDFIDLGYKANITDNLSVNFNTTYNKHNWLGSESDTIAHSLQHELLFSGSHDEINYLVGGGLEKNNWDDAERLKKGTLNTKFAYAQGDIRLTPNTKLITGFQINKIDKIKHHISERYGLIHHFTNNTGIKLLSSDAFRKAYPIETSFGSFVFLGNLELKPEKIHTNEIQLFHNDKKSESSITYFESKITDLITRVKTDLPGGSPPFRFQYVNGGSWEYNGIELESKYKANEKTSIIGSFSYQRNKRGEDHLENAALHPNEVAKLGILYNSKKIDWGLFINHLGDSTPTATTEETSKALNKDPKSFQTYSLKGATDLQRLLGLDNWENTHLSLEGFNLTGEEIVYVDYPNKKLNSFQPLDNGRSYKLSITYKFQ